MPAQGRGAFLPPPKKAPPLKKAPTVKAKPVPLTGFAEAQKPIERAAKKPVPKAGRSDKALNRDAREKVVNEVSEVTRRNIGGGMPPKKAVVQAIRAVTGKVEEEAPRGNTPARRQQERGERKEFAKQQRQDVAKT